MITKFQRQVEIVMRECGGYLRGVISNPYRIRDAGVMFWSAEKSRAIFDYSIYYSLQKNINNSLILTRKAVSREIVDTLTCALDEDKRIRIKEITMHSHVRDAKGGRLTLKISLFSGDGPNLRKLRRYAMIANKL